MSPQNLQYSRWIKYITTYCCNFLEVRKVHYTRTCSLLPPLDSGGTPPRNCHWCRRNCSRGPRERIAADQPYRKTRRLQIPRTVCVTIRLNFFRLLIKQELSLIYGCMLSRIATCLYIGTSIQACYTFGVHLRMHIMGEGFWGMGAQTEQLLSASMVRSSSADSCPPPKWGSDDEM